MAPLLFACATPAPSRPSAPAPAPELLDWRDTVALEAADRRQRLRRLTAAAPTGGEVRFDEYPVPKDRLPADFAVDIPVLRVVFPDRVFFDTDKADIKPAAMPVIDIVAESLRREPPDVALFVAGHTDSRGSAAYNSNLSVRRADAVARALLDRGIGLTTVYRVGFGESVPVAPNDTPERMGLNRRVEFVFAARVEAVAAWLASQLDQPCYGADAGRCRQQTQIGAPFEARQVVGGASGTQTVGGQKPGVAIPAPQERTVSIDLNERTYVIEDLKL